MTILLSSCNFIGGERVSGNGNVVTETRDVSDFSAVRVSSAIDLYVSQGDDYSVKVVTDENLQPFVVVAREGKVLNIGPDRNMNLSGSAGIKVYVSAPLYEMLGASGASHIVAQTALKGQGLKLDISGASTARAELDYTDIKITASGASSAEVTGQTATLDVECSGSSDFKGAGLTAVDARVDISGASGAYVFVDRSLDAEASGASEVVYDGGPKVNSRSSGASSVRAK